MLCPSFTSCQWVNMCQGHMPMLHHFSLISLVYLTPGRVLIHGDLQRPAV
jgi:hypothetical protein